MKAIDLVNKAIEGRKKSYSPYSHYAVGAALLLKMVVLLQALILKMQPTVYVFVLKELQCFKHTIWVMI